VNQTRRVFCFVQLGSGVRFKRFAELFAKEADLRQVTIKGDAILELLPFTLTQRSNVLFLNNKQ
jgi:hypothetical protein